MFDVLTAKKIWNDGADLQNWLIPDNAPPVACRNICSGGGKGGGTTTQQSTTTIPPEVLARYNAVNASAEQAASQPFTPYTGEFVAPVNSTQQGGVNTITNAAGTADPYYSAASGNLNTGLAAAQPYYGTATGQVASGLAGGTAGNYAAAGALGTALAGSQPYNASAGQSYSSAYSGAQPYNMGATGLALAGTQAVDPGALNIGQYMSPYTQSVINSTLALNDQQQAQQVEVRRAARLAVAGAQQLVFAADGAQPADGPPLGVRRFAGGPVQTEPRDGDRRLDAAARALSAG